MIKQDRKTELVNIIENNPGLNFRSIMRNTDMKNGVLSHHLSKLEKNGKVTVTRTPRQTRYFPPHISDNESNIIRALRRQTPREIIKALMYEEKLEFKQIVDFVKKSPSTVSFYLSQLVDENIVKIQFIERKKSYQISEKLVVDKLIETYYPGLIDKPASGFEDIINSL